MAGILLAIALITGTFVAIDTSARSILAAMLAREDADFGVSSTTLDIEGLSRDLLSIPEVTSAVPAAVLGGVSVRESEADSWIRGMIVGVDPANPPSDFPLEAVTGSFELSNGTALLSQFLAQQLAVEIGDQVQLQGRAFNETTETFDTRYANVTIAGMLLEDFLFGRGPGFLVVHLRDIPWWTHELFGFDPPFQYGVWLTLTVDRDRLVDPYDIAGSQARLTRVERQIQRVAFEYEGEVSNRISTTLGRFETGMQAQTGFYLFLAAPFLFLALYLGVIGAKQSYAGRRRELALLKVRGTGTRHVFTLLVLEALAIGLLAGLVGLAMGAVVAWLAFPWVMPQTDAPLAPTLVVTPNAVAIALLVGVVAMLGVGYRMGRRSAELTPVEGLRYQAPGEETLDYRPKADVVMIALAMASLGALLYRGAGGAGFFFFLFGIILVALSPLAPLFFILGATRFLTLSTGRTYEVFSRVLRPLTGSLYHVVNRNLARNPRRSTSLAVVVAISLASALLVLIVLGSQVAWEERQLRATIGADLAVTVSPEQEGKVLADLRALEEVAQVAQVVRFSGRIEYSLPSGQGEASTEILALDVPAYFEVARPETWSLGSLSSAETVSSLSTPGRLLATERLADRLPLSAGSLVTVSTARVGEEGAVAEAEATVAGTVRGLPPIRDGGQSDDVFTFGRALHMTRTIYGSLETLSPLLAARAADPGDAGVRSTTLLLVDLVRGADWRVVKAQAQNLGAAEVVVHDEAWASRLSAPLSQALFGYGKVLAAFAAVFAVGGLGLVVYAASAERTSELASMRARGARRRDVGTLLIGEAVSILLVGAAIGAAVGLFSGYLGVETFTSRLSIAAGEALIPLHVVVPLEVLYFSGAVTLGAALMLGAVVWGASRANVARVLKIRVG